MIRCPHCQAKVPVTKSDTNSAIVHLENGMVTYRVTVQVVAPNSCPQCDEKLNLMCVPEQILLSVGASLMTRCRKRTLTSERAHEIALKRWNKNHD